MSIKTIEVRSPSFPQASANCTLLPEPERQWQVLCGDLGCWRAGMFSPREVRLEDCAELERHTCPELFVLLAGRISLVLAEKEGLRVLELEQGKPVLVTVPHSGFCPDGPHSGEALVVERDSFSTEYRSPRDWLNGGYGFRMGDCDSGNF